MTLCSASVLYCSVAASTCVKNVHEWDLFCFWLIVLRKGNMKARITPAVLKPSGYLNSVCARGMPSWIFPTPK